MAYLRFSDSYWYAYSTVGTGPGDDTVLTVWCNGGGVRARAGDLKLLGPVGNVESLRQWLSEQLDFEGRTLPSQFDWIELRQAVDDFLRSVYEAGVNPMPPDVVRRVRIYRRLIERSMHRTFAGPRRSEAEVVHHYERLTDWLAFNKRAFNDYPPPQVSREILDLEKERAIRGMTWQTVSAEQDRQEHERIRAAREWPRPSGLNEGHDRDPSSSHPGAPAGFDFNEETRCVEATVIALIPEFCQAKVRDAEGRLYALTRKTRGIDLSMLYEGQCVDCVVTVRLPRVVSAVAK